MRVEHTLTSAEGTSEAQRTGGPVGGDAALVLAFGAPERIQDGRWLRDVRTRHPRAVVCGCSTAGEVSGTRVLDGSLTTTAVAFEGTRVRGARTTLRHPEDSRDAGRRLAGTLDDDGLVHVFVLSDGLHVNGSELVEGFRERLPAGVGVTGGLAADGDRFRRTFVVLDAPDDPEPAHEYAVAAVGFYGARLRVGYGSLGGWDPFGPERTITRSRANVLFELDGRSALALYKEYLGEVAAGLPSAGLLFPLSVRPPGAARSVVRTILAVDEAEQSLTFAGDMPEGAIAQLMMANFDRLVDGAVGAARAALGGAEVAPSLAVLISCFGRKLILRQRVEEEVEGVREVLGPAPLLTGFYSYGEICPFVASAACELHNQTMTITTLAEV